MKKYMAVLLAAILLVLPQVCFAGSIAQRMADGAAIGGITWEENIRIEDVGLSELLRGAGMEDGGAVSDLLKILSFRVAFGDSRLHLALQIQSGDAVTLDFQGGDGEIAVSTSLLPDTVIALTQQEIETLIRNQINQAIPQGGASGNQGDALWNLIQSGQPGLSGTLDLSPLTNWQTGLVEKMESVPLTAQELPEDAVPMESCVRLILRAGDLAGLMDAIAQVVAGDSGLNSSLNQIAGLLLGHKADITVALRQLSVQIRSSGESIPLMEILLFSDSAQQPAAGILTVQGQDENGPAAHILLYRSQTSDGSGIQFDGQFDTNRIYGSVMTEGVTSNVWFGVESEGAQLLTVHRVSTETAAENRLEECARTSLNAGGTDVIFQRDAFVQQLDPADRTSLSGESAVSVQVPGLAEGILFSIHRSFSLKDGSLPDLNTEQAVHPAAMSEDELSEWAQTATTRMSTSLTSLLQKLPDSVLNLISMQ